MEHEVFVTADLIDSNVFFTDTGFNLFIRGGAFIVSGCDTQKQADAAIAAHILKMQAIQATRQTELTRLDGLKASIAAKRTSTIWQPFTLEEATYLNGLGQ